MEKKQTNHWFVAYDQGGELRVSGWNSRNRLRPGSKHLCGQTCLHKLVDDFLARDLAARLPQAAVEEAEVEERKAAPGARTVEPRSMDASLTSDAAHGEIESSVRLVAAPVTGSTLRSPLRIPVELVPAPGRVRSEEPMPSLVQSLDEPPRFASRNWRAEAWAREREREQRAVNHSRAIPAHRLSDSK